MRRGSVDAENGGMSWRPAIAVRLEKRDQVREDSYLQPADEKTVAAVVTGVAQRFLQMFETKFFV